MFRTACAATRDEDYVIIAGGCNSDVIYILDVQDMGHLTVVESKIESPMYGLVQVMIMKSMKKEPKYLVHGFVKDSSMFIAEDVLNVMIDYYGDNDYVHLLENEIVGYPRHWKMSVTAILFS